MLLSSFSLSYRSALADHYKESGGEAMKAQLTDMLSSFMKGYKRKVGFVFNNHELSF